MSLRTRISGAYISADITGVLSEDDLAPLFDAFDDASRHGPFVLLTDTSGMDSAPRPVIMKFAERMKRLPSMKGVWLGDAVVISSPTVRFVLSTLLMIAPLPTKVKAFETREEAEQWCASILRAAGVAVPSALLKTA